MRPYVEQLEARNLLATGVSHLAFADPQHGTWDVTQIEQWTAAAETVRGVADVSPDWQIVDGFAGGGQLAKTVVTFPDGHQNLLSAHLETLVSSQPIPLLDAGEAADVRFAWAGPIPPPACNLPIWQVTMMTYDLEELPPPPALPAPATDLAAALASKPATGTPGTQTALAGLKPVLPTDAPPPVVGLPDVKPTTPKPAVAGSDLDAFWAQQFQVTNPL